MSFLKPKPQKQSSENVNNPLITSTYGGSMTQGTGAMSNLSSLLGVGGDPQAGFNNYLQNAGYAPAMRQLSQQITGQGAASGLLRSGATSNALLTRGTELNNSFFNNYLQQLAGLSGLGLQAGGLVANTGQKSTGVGGSPSTAGTIASIAGSLASIFSDRRLKDDIEIIGREPDGLGWYGFRYRGAVKRRVGVMADEVRKLRPHALGPKVAGFDTVNYGAL